MTNEKGEILARVEESRGFQEIYDYRGGQKYQHRLDRRREQASFDYSSRSHLFQKIYYANGLTAKDELALRTAFHSLNNSHETQAYLTKAALFVGFWPLAYKVSQKVRPASVFVMAVGYYYAYKNLIVPFGTQRLQDNLNNVAKPFAEKYGVTIA